MCVGIATANALIITACFTGVSLITRPVVLTVVQGAGGLFLLYVGVSFWRAASGMRASDGQAEENASEHGSTAVTTANWGRNLGLGLASGLLNPKNILFYASLAAALTDAGPGQYLFYGVWMVTVLLVWDTLVAGAPGNARALRRLDQALPTITRVFGGFLVFFGAAMLIEVASTVF